MNRYTIELTQFSKIGLSNQKVCHVDLLKLHISSLSPEIDRMKRLLKAPLKDIYRPFVR